MGRGERFGTIGKVGLIRGASQADGGTESLVFGQLFSESTLRKMHIRICKEAGLKKLRIHDLRHTFASHFMMNGGDIYDLKEILGHASVKTTMRYAHLGRKHLQSKANVVSFALSMGVTPPAFPTRRLVLVKEMSGAIVGAK